MIKLNPSIKHHTFVGLFICLWIFIFTHYIRPFDSGNYGNYPWWEFLSFGFSIIAFLSYFITTIFQDTIYRQFETWNILFEIIAIVAFHFLNLILSFIYYKSPFLNGIWNFNEYFDGILKSAIIFTPIIIFARTLTLKFLPQEKEITKNLPQKKTEEKLIIRGEYKLDILKIRASDLVCVSKSQNYVEVFFIENSSIQSKLIRSSLKKIQTDIPFLIQVHRSHLINIDHFKSWKNSNTILLTQTEIPVSKNYKNNLSVI
ncbi:LytTR family transcriptional regulator DNA-binding domain-containing protein [uncultured Tenacibaculum sp.]|uniref:LytTR family transcriptional regulator DNA-binding domain-containing protein n=1 Tax=uncultured Tenacibaculum sp. TaxID=174713 RepID=UPI002620B99D|nr:LytTR family transcriptional regulator DNA-binding domain-containing protein [uncultured Tenacibaculum sp.]